MSYLKTYKKPLIVLCLIILLAGFLTWFITKKNNQAYNPAASALGTQENQTPYTDLEGNILSLDSYLGDIIVVNSWASWSPASVTELPMLAKMSDEFSDKNVKILAINRNEPRTTAERFLKSVGVSDKVQLVLDADDRYFKSVEGYAMPETIIYDRGGNIIYHHRGAITEELVRKYIQQAD